MKISTINSTSSLSYQPKFQANLFVDKSAKEVIQSNEAVFKKAAEMFDGWLKSEKAHVAETMHIRKNTELFPKVVFERLVRKLTYAYPHEESGAYYTERVKEYENLEFEMGNRKCGFWFDKDSNEFKLLNDFKNMFNYLSNGK